MKRRRMRRSEPDVQRDDVTARTRATGGAEDAPGRDNHSTTGPSHNEVFVGRLAGDDSGYEAETGAERRAAVRRDADEERRGT